MRSRVVPVRVEPHALLDTCGTGGSAFRVFNVSTAARLWLRRRGFPSPNTAIAPCRGSAQRGCAGSAGRPGRLTPEACAACVDTVGIGFLFAPQHHPAMKQVSGPRREIGVRTLFNLLGPLTNPQARPDR